MHIGLKLACYHDANKTGEEGEEAEDKGEVSGCLVEEGLPGLDLNAEASPFCENVVKFAEFYAASPATLFFWSLW